MTRNMMEMIPERRNNIEEKDVHSLIDFVDREYFKEFLDQVDQIDKKVVNEAEKLLEIDIEKTRRYVDEKIPALLEKINGLIRSNEMEISRNNSLRDILGNSIIDIFNKIIFVLKNFRSDDTKVRNKIDNPDSITRKIIRIYSEGEGKSGNASYYIDSLCNENDKLKMELTKPAGYLENFSEYFPDIEIDGKISKNYPTGSKKLPYFRFFSELEKGNINRDNLEEELKKLKDEFVDKDKIRAKFGN